MKPSEIVRELAKDLEQFLNQPKFEGIIMNAVTLNAFLVNWLLDNNKTIKGE